MFLNNYSLDISAIVIPLIATFIYVYLSAPSTNLALFNPNGICTAYGTATGQKCDGAFDGNTVPSASTIWHSNYEWDGEWIQRQFPGMVLITHVVIWHPCRQVEQYRTLNVSFSDGQTIEVFMISLNIVRRH
jgi:hypothetical protein